MQYSNLAMLHKINHKRSWGVMNEPLLELSTYVENEATMINKRKDYLMYPNL